ncbi:MAG TPA: ATP-binding protein [Steroidobacteraceae bacterium]|nr:ATP-binding protein [Steroidobacteraceae bacterium]
MRSIGARLALWYAGAAILTMMCLFVAGYYLLENQLIRGLDLLNKAQFTQIRAHLGEDFASLNPRVIDARIRETSNFSSVLFFITIDDPGGSVRPVFYSTNLRGMPIPDVPGQRVFNAKLPGIGELRVGEFILGPFDVTIATSLNNVREAMHDYSEISIWMLAVMVAISAAVGFGLSRLALRPVRLIRDTANHISSDNLSERIPVAAVRDEISELAQLLNQMFDRLESAFDQIRRFTAEASHELKTPLSLIRLQAEKLLMNGNLDAANEESVHMQLEEIARLSQIIEELLFLSRAEARDIDLHFVEHDPEGLLASFSQDARVLSEHRGLQYVHTHQGAGTVLVEPRWLRRVLLNLLANALNASPPGGTVTLRSLVDADHWLVSLDDEGPGVPNEFRERIFERFFRMASALDVEETGSGLGLAICRSIILLHGGRIWAESSPTSLTSSTPPGLPTAPKSPGLRVVFTIPTAARA